MRRHALGMLLAIFSVTGKVHGEVADHLQCFNVTDPLAKAGYTADLEALAVEEGCTITVPAKLECVASSVAGISPQPSGAGGSGGSNGFTCYKVRCPRAALPAFNADDEFGSHTLTARRKGQLLCAPNSGPTAGGFPATGQTLCWDGGGSLIPCAGSGEDGQFRKGGPLRYTDNGDGTITDDNTGLVWEKQSRDGSIHDALNSYTWPEAFVGHVATLNALMFAGYSDWRVPNVKELASIVNYNSVPAVSRVFNSACVPGCNVLSCSCTNVGYTWTSTVYANFNARGFFWAVDFGVGNVQAVMGTAAVRGVRGGGTSGIPTIPPTVTSTVPTTTSTTTSSTTSTTIPVGGCGMLITAWGTYGTANGEFADPFGVAVDASGNVFVTDSRNHRVQKFANDGTFITAWGSMGSSTGQFMFPYFISVDGSGNVFVGDTGNYRIEKFDNSGRFLTAWGMQGAGIGNFEYPAGIATDSGGNVFVADPTDARVQVFDNGGTYLTTLGSNGTGPFYEPYGLAVDGAGNVFIADSLASVIYKFSSTGTLLTQWGGQFTNPEGLSVDAGGNLFVVDAGNNRMERFDNNGTLLSMWGGLGSGPGQFFGAMDAAVDAKGNVFVADELNDRIQKFACP